VRWVRGPADLLAALTEIGKGRLSFREYLGSLGPPLECAVFAFDDPLPAVVDIPSLLYRICRTGDRRTQLFGWATFSKTPS